MSLSLPEVTTRLLPPLHKPTLPVFTPNLPNGFLLPLSSSFLPNTSYRTTDTALGDVSQGHIQCHECLSVLQSTLTAFPCSQQQLTVMGWTPPRLLLHHITSIDDLTVALFLLSSRYTLEHWITEFQPISSTLQLPNSLHADGTRHLCVISTLKFLCFQHLSYRQ